MSDMSSLLDKLYRANSATPAIEKTAEANLLAALRGDRAVAEESNPYATMSDEDLVKIASDLGITAEDAGDDEDLEKVAADMLGGQIMAHAMIHEFGLMKEAMAKGKCRVCKQNDRDVKGSSVCSSCHKA